jgi:hypothetical protein
MVWVGLVTLVVWGAGRSWGLLPAAYAYDIEVNAETIGQGYQIASGAGTLISRRRLDQYLGLHLWNIGPKDNFGAPLPRNQVYFDLSLRFDTDFASDCRPDPSGARPCVGWAVPTTFGGRDVSQELRNNRFELLYALAGVRDLGGLVDLELGRQLLIDQFEFTSFDGLHAAVKTPYHFAAEVWGGLLVNGTAPIDSPIFRPDGTALSPLSPHDVDYKPTLGVAVRSFGLRDLDTRFSYRRTFSPAQNTTEAERRTGAVDGTTEEKIGWSARGRLLGGRIVPWAGLRYNVLVGVFDVIQGGARFTLSKRHSLQVEYVYSYPTFDGDSIWNVFARRQFDDLRASYDLRVGRLRAYARGLLRAFHDVAETTDRVDPTLPPPSPGGLGERLNYGGNLGGRVEVPGGYVRLDSYLETGYGGTRVGVDAATRMQVYRDFIALEGRLTYVHFRNDQRPIDSGNSFGFQVGARAALGRGILLHALLEDNFNRFYRSQFRFYLVFDFSFLLSPRGFAQAVPPGIGPGLGQFANPLGTGRGI